MKKIGRSTASFEVIFDKLRQKEEFVFVFFLRLEAGVNIAEIVILLNAPRPGWKGRRRRRRWRFFFRAGRDARSCVSTQ